MEIIPPGTMCGNLELFELVSPDEGVAVRKASVDLRYISSVAIVLREVIETHYCFTVDDTMMTNRKNVSIKISQVFTDDLAPDPTRETVSTLPYFLPPNYSSILSAFWVMSPLDFIAQISFLIKDKNHK